MSPIIICIAAAIAGLAIPRVADITSRYFSWGEIAARKDEGRRMKDKVKSVSSLIMFLACGVACAIVFSLYHVPEFWQQVVIAGGIWCALVMSVADWRKRIIPDLVLFPFLLGGLMIAPVSPIIAGGYAEAVMTAVFAYVLCAIIDYVFARVSNKTNVPIGAGDLKLVAIGSVWLGAAALPVALAVGAVAAYLWGHLRGEKFIPFAPFFFFGTMVALMLLSLA